jgi:hypothetical protein
MAKVKEEVKEEVKEVLKENLTLNNILNCIQSQLKAPKGQFNKFGGYNYRSCEDILEAVKPLLLKYNVTLNLTDEIVMIGNRYYVKAVAILSDALAQISAIAYAREAENKKGMDESQITGAASSYARKYALNGMFLIDDTKDADATNQHDKVETKKLEPRKPVPPELTFDDLSEPAKQIMSAFDLSATIKVLSNCVGQNKDEIAKLPKAEADYLRNYYTKRLAEIKSGKGIK